MRYARSEQSRLSRNGEKVREQDVASERRNRAARLDIGPPLRVQQILKPASAGHLPTAPTPPRETRPPYKAQMRGPNVDALGLDIAALRAA